MSNFDIVEFSRLLDAGFELRAESAKNILNQESADSYIHGLSAMRSFAMLTVVEVLLKQSLDQIGSIESELKAKEQIDNH